MTQPDTELEDILDDYATAHEGYEASDGKPVFTEQMDKAKARLEARDKRIRLEAKIEELNHAGLSEYNMKGNVLGHTYVVARKAELQAELDQLNEGSRDG